MCRDTGKGHFVFLQLTGSTEQVAPITWGQEYMRRGLEPHRPNEGWTNGATNIDATGMRLETITAYLKAVEGVLSKYDVFRTHFSVSEGGIVRQVVLKQLSAPVTVFNNDEAARFDCDAFRQAPFDLWAQPLFRVALEERANKPVRLHIAWSHLLLDAWSSRTVVRDLTAALSSSQIATGTYVQPVARADWEISQGGQTYNERSLQYWKKLLPRFLAAYPTAQDHTFRPPARFLIGELEAPKLVSAAKQAAAAIRVSTATVLIGSVCVMVSDILNLHDLPFLVRTSNRAGKFASTIGQLSQDAPVIFEYNAGLVAGSLQDLHRGLLLAQRYGAYAPADLETTMSSAPANASDLRVLINCHEATGKQAREISQKDAKSQDSFAWVSQRSFDPVLFYVDIFPDEERLVFMVNTDFISATIFEAAIPGLVDTPIRTMD